MSVPWSWLGSWFPSCENTIDSGDIGEGTDYPVIWTNTPDTTGKGVAGSTASTEIVPFEWMTQQITLSVSGTVTLVFHDYTGGGHPDTPMSTPFSFSLSAWGSLDPEGDGETWDILEPAGTNPNVAHDYPSGPGFGSANTWSALNNGLAITVTLPWGPDAFLFIMGFDVVDLLAVNGTDFGSYVKQVVAYLKCSTSEDFYSAVGVELNANTDMIINGITIEAPMTTDQGPVTVFHATPHLWGGAGGTGASGCSMTISAFSLSVTQHYTEPAPIA